MKVLVINAGSSSMKYQLIDMETSAVMAKGNCERIGIDGKIGHKTSDGRELEQEMDFPTHEQALEAVIAAITSPEHGVIESISQIDAIGHRVVHGGRLTRASLVDADALIAISDACKLAPLHNPAAIKGIQVCARLFPGTRQAVVCDTSFHDTLPDYAYMYALPYELYERHQIRRYGFHGISHQYVALKAAEFLWEKPENVKIITCHLGNGSSITAVDGGRCVDTTMGFTPLEGLMMGSRCGSIDPAIVTYLVTELGLDGKGLDDLLNKQSGLLGVSGRSADFRDVCDGAKEGDPRCILARKMLIYQIKKYIGSYAAAMNGLDILVFTAGIGENSQQLREAVCADMDFLGIHLDEKANRTVPSGKMAELSTPGSKVKVLKVPTDEEYMIALETQKLVQEWAKQAAPVRR